MGTYDFMMLSREEQLTAISDELALAEKWSGRLHLDITLKGMIKNDKHNKNIPLSL